MWSLAGFEMVAMAAVLEFRSSPSVPRSGSDAGKVVEVVFFFDGSAPTGRGGEGSDRLEMGDDGGGPG